MFSPFALHISPMERLFLINFEKDPDEIYIGFEPQYFNDASYGTGLRIIAWRKDGYIDAYQQPGLTIEKKIDVAAKGLAETIVKLFRQWPKTYLWTAKIKLSEGTPPYMESSWRRVSHE